MPTATVTSAREGRNNLQVTDGCYGMPECHLRVYIGKKKVGHPHPVLLQYCTFSAKPVSPLSTKQHQNLENKFPDQLSSENWWSQVRPLQRCELQQGRLRAEIRKNFFTDRIVKHWNRFFREVVESPPLRVSKM